MGKISEIITLLCIDVNDDWNLPVLEYNVTHLIVYMYVLQNHFVHIMGFAWIKIIQLKICVYIMLHFSNEDFEYIGELWK